MMKTYVMPNKIKDAAEDKSAQSATTATKEDIGTSKEVEDTVTPEMLEAGKLAFDKSSNNNTDTLEKSIGEAYVAMAATDQAALSEKKNVAEIKHDTRVNIRLYGGVIAMLILALAVITMMVVTLFF